MVSDRQPNNLSRLLRGVFTDELPHLVYLSLNGILLMAWYSRHERVVSELSLVVPDRWAALHFHAYILTLLTSLAAFFWTLTLVESQFLPGRAGHTWMARVSVLVMTAICVLVVMDTRLFETIGVHIYSPLVLETISNQDANRELHLDGGATRSLLWLCGGVLLGQIVLFLSTRWVVDRLGPGRRGSVAVMLLTGTVAGGLITTFATRAAAQSAASYLDALPFYAELLAEPRFDGVAGDVHYLTFDGAPVDLDDVPRPSLEKQPDILFVVAESLRADQFTTEMMPQMTALLNHPSCVRSPHHYSGGHTTEYGVFTLLYGLDGFHYEPIERDGVQSYPLTVLKRAGYTLLGASASQLRAWNGGEFMFQEFDRYQEFVDIPADEGDPEVVDFIVNAASETAGPHFAFAFFNSTHHNYLYPPSREKFTPVIPRDYDHFLGDDRLAEKREPIMNRYRNSVGWVDELAADLVARFPRTDRDLIVVFTGDHGEEFWEHGLLGHGAARFVEQRISVPLLFCSSTANEWSSGVEFSSHVDVWPTILEEIGAGNVAPLSEWSSGIPMQTAREPGRDAIYIGGLDFPWDFDTMALIDGERKYWMQLCTGEELCVEPFRVTTMDDEPLDVGAGHDALERHVSRIYDELGRWVDISAEGQ